MFFRAWSTGCTGGQRGIHLFPASSAGQSLWAYIIVPTLPFPVHSARPSLSFSDKTWLTHTKTEMESMTPDSHKGPSGAGRSLPEIHFSTWLRTPGTFGTLWFCSFQRRERGWLYRMSLLDGPNSTKTDSNPGLCRAADLHNSALSARWRGNWILSLKPPCAFPPLHQTEIKSCREPLRKRTSNPFS